ncbi:DUF6134 family protein [uncultured Dokdonia sp.]|uniref:DUF6134 family protein n=1 Tax=uncultured Dokdonia sp. TaxID=575653 RepID=UPI00261C6C6E|nr:DUF6134 family protein [uncultured Dokdonia sp.]
MRYYIFLICMLVSSWSTSAAQVENRYFDIIHNNKVIGNLKAEKTIDDNKTLYQSTTNITATIIWETQINYNYKVLFESGLLQTSDVDIFVNDKPRAQTYTRKQDSLFIISRDNKRPQFYKEPINYTTIQLYFEEPTTITSCYSEQDGSINKLVALGNHSYKKVNAKGRENLYFYKDGRLIKASIDGGIIQFELVATAKM